MREGEVTREGDVVREEQVRGEQVRGEMMIGEEKKGSKRYQSCSHFYMCERAT